MAWPGDESETNGTEQGVRWRPHLQITWIKVLHWSVEKAEALKMTIHKKETSTPQGREVQFLAVASGATDFDFKLACSHTTLSNIH